MATNLWGAVLRMQAVKVMIIRMTYRAEDDKERPDESMVAALAKGNVGLLKEYLCCMWASLVN